MPEPPLSPYLCLHCRRPTFDLWIRKISWRREWLHTPVFLPVAWWATVHGVTKSWTKLSNYHVHFHFMPSKHHKPISNWTSDHPLHGGNLLRMVFLVTGRGNFILPVVLLVLIPLFLWTPHINGQQILSDPSLKYVQSLPPASHTLRDSELHLSPYCLPPGVLQQPPSHLGPSSLLSARQPEGAFNRRNQNMSLLYLPHPGILIWLESKGWSHYSGL